MQLDEERKRHATLSVHQLDNERETALKKQDEIVRQLRSQLDANAEANALQQANADATIARLEEQLARLGGPMALTAEFACQTEGSAEFDEMSFSTQQPLAELLSIDTLDGDHTEVNLSLQTEVEELRSELALVLARRESELVGLRNEFFNHRDSAVAEAVARVRRECEQEVERLQQQLARATADAHQAKQAFLLLNDGKDRTAASLQTALGTVERLGLATATMALKRFSESSSQTDPHTTREEVHSTTADTQTDQESSSIGVDAETQTTSQSVVGQAVQAHDELASQSEAAVSQPNSDLDAGCLKLELIESAMREPQTRQQPRGEQMDKVAQTSSFELPSTLVLLEHSETQPIPAINDEGTQVTPVRSTLPRARLEFSEHAVTEASEPRPTVCDVGTQMSPVKKPRRFHAGSQTTLIKAIDEETQTTTFSLEADVFAENVAIVDSAPCASEFQTEDTAWKSLQSAQLSAGSGSLRGDVDSTCYKMASSNPGRLNSDTRVSMNGQPPIPWHQKSETYRSDGVNVSGTVPSLDAQNHSESLLVMPVQLSRQMTEKQVFATPRRVAATPTSLEPSLDVAVETPARQSTDSAVQCRLRHASSQVATQVSLQVDSQAVGAQTEVLPSIESSTQTVTTPLPRISEAQTQTRVSAPELNALATVERESHVEELRNERAKFAREKEDLARHYADTMESEVSQLKNQFSTEQRHYEEEKQRLQQEHAETVASLVQAVESYLAQSETDRAESVHDLVRGVQSRTAETVTAYYTDKLEERWRFSTPSTRSGPPPSSRKLTNHSVIGHTPSPTPSPRPTP